MSRVKPFRRLEIDQEICEKISRLIEARRYRGSFTSFVESILELYGDGLLTETKTRADFVGFEERANEKRGKRAS